MVGGKACIELTWNLNSNEKSKTNKSQNECLRLGRGFNVPVSKALRAKRNTKVLCFKITLSEVVSMRGSFLLWMVTCIGNIQL